MTEANRRRPKEVSALNGHTPGVIELKVSGMMPATDLEDSHVEIGNALQEKDSKGKARFGNLIDGLISGEKHAYAWVNRPGHLRIVIFSGAAIAAATAAGIELGQRHGRDLREIVPFLKPQKKSRRSK